MTPEQKRDFDRASKLICRINSSQSVLPAAFARSEQMHRYPDDYGIREMGELLWHRENYYRDKDIEALRAVGKEPLPPSAAMHQFRSIQRQVFKCGRDNASLIASYTNAVRKMRELSFRIPEEKEEVEITIGLLEEAIERLKAELIPEI